MEKARHRIFPFAMDTLNPNFLSQKLNVAFDCLKFRPCLNVDFDFVLKNVEIVTSGHYFAHEKNTRLELSKVVAIAVNLTEQEIILKNTDVIESCTRKRINPKWGYYKLTNVKFLLSLVKEAPMG